MIDEKGQEKSCDVIFLLAYIGIHLVWRAIHSQKMFIYEVTVEAVSDYIRKEIITTWPVPLKS